MTKKSRSERRATARNTAAAAAGGAGARAGAKGRRGRTVSATIERGVIATIVHDHPMLVLGALIALNLLFALLTFMPQPHTGGDSANYLTLARSLLQAHTYTDLYDPITPPHTKYPPVFPLMLATGMLLGLKTWVQLKLLMAAVGTAAVAFTFLWIRRRGRPALALGASLLLIFSAGVLEQSHWLLSDVPFWMFTMLALLAFDRLRADDWSRLALAVAATVLAYFTRSAGLPLVLAATIWLLWRRRWTQLAVFFAVLLPLAVLWWLRAHHTGGVEYTQEFWYVDPYMPQLGKITFGQLLQRMWENAQKYATIHLPLLLSGQVGSMYTTIGIALTAFALFGWATRLGNGLRRVMVAEVMMPLYIGLLFVWPAVWSGERFLVPIMPLLLYYGAVGFTRALRIVTKQHVALIGTAVTALLLLFNIPPLTASIAAGRMCTREYRAGDPYPCLQGPEQAYFEAAIWSRSNLPADAVVLSRKPRLFYEISHGLRGSNYPMTRDPREFFALTDSIHARYVVYDRLTSLADYYLAPILLQRPQAFCALRQFGTDGTAVFGIMPGAAAMPDQPAQSTEAPFQACDRTFLR
jgi:4-amino-4-deoxy-L-arabinose transferase-like glycosyltransferase